MKRRTPRKSKTPKRRNESPATEARLMFHPGAYYSAMRSLKLPRPGRVLDRSTAKGLPGGRARARAAGWRSRPPVPRSSLASRTRSAGRKG